eukprot:3615730-Amphidinium_carterae.1
MHIVEQSSRKLKGKRIPVMLQSLFKVGQDVEGGLFTVHKNLMIKFTSHAVAAVLADGARAWRIELMHHQEPP